MKIGVNMTTSENEFDVGHWWAKSPDFVIDSLNRQLIAAAAIWPELSGYRIGASARADHSKRGSLGGVARAAALPPEQRKEIASNAAKARWSKPTAA